MKNKKQFTLIELIIVIVVIGILAAMALPKFNGVVRNAKLSAMINDKEVLEKALVMYYQKNDELPLLNDDQELIVENEGISLSKIVLAEEVQSGDMDTIYKSLKETLTYYNDSEETLYRIDLSKIKNNLSKDIKYGHKKHDKDFYVYSTKTGNVYYYDYLINSNGTIQHTEYDTLLKDNELVEKKFSYNLDSNGNSINNKPIIELNTNLENLKNDTIINWEYSFTDEDKEPTKISFVLNNIEYDSFDKIPTKLESGDYTIKFKMQDSKGLWSDEIVKTFIISNNVLEEIIYVYIGKSSDVFKEIGYFDKTGEFVVTNLSTINTVSNLQYVYLSHDYNVDYTKFDDMFIEISTNQDTINSNYLDNSGWDFIKPNYQNYTMPLKGISKTSITTISNKRLIRIMQVKSKVNNTSILWKFTNLKIVKNKN